MKITPPTSKANGGTTPGLTILRVGALLVAVFCGWQLVGLPGALIRKYVPPFDMPWYGFGVKQVAIDEEGNWHVARDGYADRASYYIIRPGKQPEKFDVVPPQLYKLDRSGSISVQSVEFAAGELAVKSSGQYWAWRSRLKNLAHTRRERDTAYESTGARDFVGPSLPQEPNVVLNYSNPGQHIFRVLEGYQHYPVFDGAAALAPNVWLTTDRGRNIHRLVFHGLENNVPFQAVVTKPTILKANLAHSALLGVLADQDLLFMVLPSGRTDYYNAHSLEFIRSEQLPGDWRREYGELMHPSGTYSFYQGLPLAQSGYNRIMRTLMLLFLLSLITLALSWSTAWNSISDRTTGDTTPNLS